MKLILTLITAVGFLTLLSACTPTVKVDASEPITINMNVKVEHEIRVKVDKEIDDLFANDDLF